MEYKIVIDGLEVVAPTAEAVIELVRANKAQPSNGHVPNAATPGGREQLTVCEFVRQLKDRPKEGLRVLARAGGDMTDDALCAALDCPDNSTLAGRFITPIRRSGNSLGFDSHRVLLKAEPKANSDEPIRYRIPTEVMRQVREGLDM